MLLNSLECTYQTSYILALRYCFNDSIIFILIGIRKNVKEMFIDQMGCQSLNIDTIDNVSCCKFSRNKNNLHVLGLSLGCGQIFIQQTITDSVIAPLDIQKS